MSDTLPSKEQVAKTLRYWAGHLATWSDAALLAEYSKLWAKIAETCTTAAGLLEAAQPTPEPPAEPDQPAVIQLVAVKNGRACVIGIPAHYSKLPEDHPWQHNCDANGCTSVEHMLWRGPVQDESTAQPPGPVPKWKIGDMVKLAPRSAEFEIIGMRIVCDIGVGGKRVAVYDQDELLPPASKDARAESEREVFNIVHRGGLGPTKGEG